jgi:hypothetical protein
MSNDNTALIIVAVGAFLLLRRRPVYAQGVAGAGSAAWNGRYMASPALAGYQTAQRQSSQSQLIAGGFGLLGQAINKYGGGSGLFGSGNSSQSGDYSTTLPPDSIISNEAPSAPSYSTSDTGQAGDLGDFYG